MKDFIYNILKDSKNYKAIAWVFILAILILVVFYPIIDANFLYYRRVSNRIEILEKISELDNKKISSNKKLKQEYNSIIKEISEKEDNYLNNIFIKETKFKNNLIKFIGASWLFIILGFILSFKKDKLKNKWTITNLISGIFCIGAGILFGYIGIKIPTIINITINIFLYQIIIIFLAYTISTFGNKKTNISHKSE